MSGNISKKPETAAANPSDPELRRVLSEIRVGGLTPFTTIDFPGRLAGVFYLQGCPWRCRYCYNSELWPFSAEENRILPEKIVHYLETRRGRLDGIVFSGGEPTAHPELGKWMAAVKSLGFQIALHTNGMFPERFLEVLPFCDWVGMDIKAPFDRYETITLVPGSGICARKSIEKLVTSGVSFECRTTFHPTLLSEDDILTVARELKLLGVKDFCLQMFRPEGCTDKILRDAGFLNMGISTDLNTSLREMFSGFCLRS